MPAKNAVVLPMQYGFKCAPSLPANYTTYRGRQHVKKQRSVPRIEGDAEGLKLHVLLEWRCHVNYAENLHYFCFRNTSGNQLFASAISVQCGLFTKAFSKNTRSRTTEASRVFLVRLLIPYCLVMHVFVCLLPSKEITFILNIPLWCIQCKEMNRHSQQKCLFSKKLV
jgi:hypothetical protein